MTQNTNIPGNPEGSRTIPLSGLLPPGDNSPQTDGAESCPRAAEVPCPLVPTTTVPTSPQSRLSRDKGHCQAPSYYYYGGAWGGKGPKPL